MESNLLETWVIDGLKFITFKSEKFSALLVNKEYCFMAVGVGEYNIGQAIDRALDDFLNGEFRPLDENLNRIEGE